MNPHQWTVLEVLAVCSLAVNAVAVPVLSVAWWAIRSRLGSLKEQMDVLAIKLDDSNDAFVPVMLCKQMHESLQRELKAVFAPLTEHVQRTQQILDVKERLSEIDKRVSELERRQ